MTGDVYLQMLQSWLTDEILQMTMKISFVNKAVFHLTGSSLSGRISMAICRGDGSGILVVKTKTVRC